MTPETDPARVDGRKPTTSPRQLCRVEALLAVLAGLLLLLSVYFAIGPRGDISYRSGCRGTTVHAFLHPQATHPELDTDFVDPARLCNRDAVHKMHRVFVLLPVAAVVGLGALALRRRRSGGSGSVRVAVLPDHESSASPAVAPLWHRVTAVGVVVLLLAVTVVCLALEVWVAAAIVGVLALWRLALVAAAARAGWATQKRS